MRYDSKIQARFSGTNRTERFDARRVGRVSLTVPEEHTAVVSGVKYRLQCCTWYVKAIGKNRRTSFILAYIKNKVWRYRALYAK